MPHRNHNIPLRTSEKLKHPVVKPCLEERLLHNRMLTCNCKLDRGSDLALGTIGSNAGIVASSTSCHFFEVQVSRIVTHPSCQVASIWMGKQRNNEQPFHVLGNIKFSPSCLGKLASSMKDNRNWPRHLNFTFLQSKMVHAKSTIAMKSDSTLSKKPTH